MRFLTGFILIGCLCGFFQSAVADSNTPFKYVKSGVSFDMLEGWAVTDDDEGGGGRFIFVESEESLFIISIFSPQHDVALEDYMDTIEENMTNSMPFGTRTSGERSDIRRMIAGEEQLGRQNNFAVAAFGAEVPHTGRYFMVRSPVGVVYFHVQVPDEDLSAEQAGIDRIFDSFKFE